MKNKKSLLLVVLALLLVCTTIAGTLAYLTSKDVVTNTFAVGKVGITLTESDTDNDSSFQANAYHLIPGTTYTKDPKVTVETGSEDSWIFVEVENQISSIEGGTTVDAQIRANGWAVLSTDEDTTIYFKFWEAADGYSLPVFANVTVNEFMNNVDMQAVNGKQIIVTAYAIQAENVAAESDDAATNAANAATAWEKLGKQADYDATRTPVTP